MITLLYTDVRATFNAAHAPAPLDLYYMRGPWRSWLCARGMDGLVVGAGMVAP